MVALSHNAQGVFNGTIVAPILDVVGTVVEHTSIVASFGSVTGDVVDSPQQGVNVNVALVLPAVKR
jgi:hypothetical protein